MFREPFAQPAAGLVQRPHPHPAVRQGRGSPGLPTEFVTPDPCLFPTRLLFKKSHPPQDTICHGQVGGWAILGWAMLQYNPRPRVHPWRHPWCRPKNGPFSRENWPVWQAPLGGVGGWVQIQGRGYVERTTARNSIITTHHQLYALLLIVDSIPHQNNILFLL